MENQDEKYSVIMRDLKTAIQNIYPESMVDVRMYGFSSDKSPLLTFTLGKDKSEYSNAIINNDDMHTSIHVDFVSGGKYKVKSTSAQSISRNPIKELPDEKFLAYGRIKTGWRDFSSYSQEQVVTKIASFFQKTKELLRENKSLLTSKTIELCEAKGYFKS